MKRSKIKPILTSLLLICLTFQVLSQTITLDLESAIDSAMKNNVKIQQYQQVVKQKEFLVKAATGNFFPSIDVLGGYTYFSQNPEINMSQVKGSIDHIFGEYGAVIARDLDLSDKDQEWIYNTIVSGLGELPAYNVVIDQQNYPSLNITALQPVFLGGKVIAGKRFAEAELGYAGEDLKQITNEIVKETVARYFGVVLLKEVVKTRKEVLDGMKKHEQQAKRAIEIGVIPAHELLRAQVAVAEAKRALKDDQSRLDIALLALKTTMGFDRAINIDATSELEYRIVPLSVDNLNNQALTNQPIFGMIDQQKVMVDQQHALNVSEFLPQVAAWGEYGFFREEYPVIMPPAMVGVQAKINIFNGLSKVNKLKATKYLNEELLKADEYAHDQVNLWIESSYRTVLSSEQAYLEAEPTVKLARKNLEINEKRFQEGLSKSIDVIDARLLYEGVLIERHESLYEYYVALTELYLATGTPQKVIEILN